MAHDVLLQFVVPIRCHHPYQFKIHFVRHLFQVNIQNNWVQDGCPDSIVQLPQSYLDSIGEFG